MSVANVAFQLESNHIGMGIRKVAQIVKYGDFTDDGGDVIGDMSMDKSVPAGSFILGCKVTVKTGFTGDTSATLKIGVAKDGGTLSGNSTINVFTAARNLVASAFISSVNGPVAVSSDQIIYLGVTSDSDFSDITAGEMLVEVYYLSTNLELTDYQPTEVNLSA